MRSDVRYFAAQRMPEWGIVNATFVRSDKSYILQIQKYQVYPMTPSLDGTGIEIDERSRVSRMSSEESPEEGERLHRWAKRFFEEYKDLKKFRRRREASVVAINDALSKELRRLQLIGQQRSVSQTLDEMATIGDQQRQSDGRPGRRAIRACYEYSQSGHFAKNCPSRRCPHLAQRTLEPIGQQVRWLERIEEFDFAVVHRAGKSHVNADGMSRHPCPR